MIYSPHTLYKKCTCEIRVDKFGKPLPPTHEWVEIGRCRCDDDTTQELVSDNGKRYKSRSHIVCNRTRAIVAGDEIRCEDADGNIISFGVVGMVQSTNYLSYTELWT